MTTDAATDKRTQLLKRLADQTDRLKTESGWQQWLDVASRFRSYSRNNQLLIALQRPDATMVAGYRTWAKVGRQVRKGERGIAIIAPSLRRQRDEESADESPKRIITGFRVVYVFDVAQTEGEPLPDFRMLDVEAPAELFDRLLTVVRDSGQIVNYADTEDTARGWFNSNTGEISLVEAYPKGDRVRTLLHELGHAHDPHLRERSRDELELVAESVAYIVGTGCFGLAMDDASSFYVMTWDADTKRLMALTEDILVAVRKVEEIVRPAALSQPAEQLDLAM